MKERINKVIDHLNPNLSLKSRNEITDICKEIKVSENSLIVEKGKRNNSEYFLLNGIVRSYLTNQNGELNTLLFFEESSVLSPHVTRTSNSKSLINLEAVTECTLARIDAGEFENLIEKNLEIREFANTVLRQELLQKTNKEIRLISWTSKQRLEQFRKDFRMLENLVPHSMIATYLGITNVSLSRLRKGS
ncbi:MAG: Crp/Fnr family transcriptional regulator [Cyclobacteriaceae bacterium]